MDRDIIAKKYYAIEDRIAERVHLIKSYERDAQMPISFVHYKYTSHVDDRQRYNRKNDFFTLFIFVRPGLGFLFGETLYTPCFGDVILVQEQTPFSVFSERSQFDYYEINLPSSFLHRIYKDNPFSALLADRMRSPMISLGREQKEEILFLLQSAENAEGDLLCYSYLIQLAHILCHGKAERAHTKKIPKTLSTAMEYMNSHHAQIAGAEEVARHCGVSTTYLTRLFQRALACTTTEYLNRLRISHAKSLLLSGLSATEACYGAGFNCYTYFITKFKEETGITPAKFRS